MLAFWNGGNPRVVRNTRRVSMPNGDVRLNAGPDPDNDLYNFVSGAKPGAFQRIVSTSYDNDGWTITETHTFIDIELDDAKAKRKADVTAKFRTVRNGGTVVEMAPGVSVAIDTTNDAVTELKGVRDYTALGATQKAVTRSGALITFTHDMANGVIAAIEAHVSAANDQEFDLHAAIDAAGHMAAVQAIDIDSGWPANPELEI